MRDTCPLNSSYLEKFIEEFMSYDEKLLLVSIDSLLLFDFSIISKNNFNTSNKTLLK